MTNILYTRTVSTQSKVLKQMLNKKGIEFTERNLDSKEVTLEEIQTAAPDAKKLPVLIMDGQVIGGLKEAHAYFQSNVSVKSSSVAQQAAKAAMPKLNRPR